MHTICLLSLKGGAGKSTVVQSLSVCATQHGQNTLVVELDPQGTLKNWANRREASEPRVIQTLPQSLDDVLQEARQNDTHWVFLDTPGHNASTAAAAAEYADVILIPCKIQSVKDFDSVMASLAEVKRAGKPAYVLMTQVPPNAFRFVRQRQLEIQKHYDTVVLSRYLSRRADFEYCDAKGLSASEYNPKGEAAQEVYRLYTLLQSIFIMLKPRHATNDADIQPMAEISSSVALKKQPSEDSFEPARAVVRDVSLPAPDTEQDGSLEDSDLEEISFDTPEPATVADYNWEQAEDTEVPTSNFAVIGSAARESMRKPTHTATQTRLTDILDVPNFLSDEITRLRRDRE